MCCSVLQCVVVCCSVLQCAAGCCRVLQCIAMSCNVWQFVAVCCSVMVWCSVYCCVRYDEVRFTSTLWALYLHSRRRYVKPYILIQQTRSRTTIHHQKIYVINMVEITGTKKLALFQECVELFPENSGLFQENIGLFQKNVCLFQENIGLFREDTTYVPNMVAMTFWAFLTSTCGFNGKVDRANVLSVSISPAPCPVLQFVVQRVFQSLAVSMEPWYSFRFYMFAVSDLYYVYLVCLEYLTCGTLQGGVDGRCGGATRVRRKDKGVGRGSSKGQ